MGGGNFCTLGNRGGPISERLEMGATLGNGGGAISKRFNVLLTPNPKPDVF